MTPTELVARIADGAADVTDPSGWSPSVAISCAALAISLLTFLLGRRDRRRDERERARVHAEEIDCRLLRDGNFIVISVENLSQKPIREMAVKASVPGAEVFQWGTCRVNPKDCTKITLPFDAGSGAVHWTVFFTDAGDRRWARNRGGLEMIRRSVRHLSVREVFRRLRRDPRATGAARGVQP